MTDATRLTGTIHFEWNGEETIPKDHREALLETAIEQIGDQMQRGCHQGELHDNIHMLDSDPEEGVSYHGSWRLQQDSEK